MELPLHLFFSFPTHNSVKPFCQHTIPSPSHLPESFYPSSKVYSAIPTHQNHSPSPHQLSIPKTKKTCNHFIDYRFTYMIKNPFKNTKVILFLSLIINNLSLTIIPSPPSASFSQAHNSYKEPHTSMDLISDLIYQ